MSPPPAPNEEARSWLRVAARDLELANLAMQNEPPFTGEALYHAQQAAEKALKGFLVSRGVAYPMTHDIRKLLELTEDLDPALRTTLAPAADLTQFAVRFRYPGDEPPSRDEALPWVDLARNVYDEVVSRLSPESSA